MTGLETGAVFGLEFGPGVVVGPEVASGSVAGTGPEPGDGVGLGPETEPEAATEPEVGPEAVAEPGVGFVPVFEMKLVPGGGTEVGPSTEGGHGLGPGPVAKFGFGTEMAPEVGLEQGAVLGLGVSLAETELGPVGGFGLVLGTGGALEPECVAFVARYHDNFHCTEEQ